METLERNSRARQQYCPALAQVRIDHYRGGESLWDWRKAD